MKKIYHYPIAHRFLELRSKRGIDQTEFGKLFGVDQPTVSRLENGRRVLKETAETICRRLEIELAEYFTSRRQVVHSVIQIIEWLEASPNSVTDAERQVLERLFAAGVAILGWQVQRGSLFFLARISIADAIRLSRESDRLCKDLPMRLIGTVPPLPVVPSVERGPLPTRRSQETVFVETPHPDAVVNRIWTDFVQTRFQKVPGVKDLAAGQYALLKNYILELIYSRISQLNEMRKSTPDTLWLVLEHILVAVISGQRETTIEPFGDLRLRSLKDLEIESRTGLTAVD